MAVRNGAAAAAIILFLLLPDRSICQVKVHYIHWNASNPNFNSGGEYSIDLGLGDNPWEYHQANIICPFYPNGGGGGGNYERYIVHNVTRAEYERCRLDPGDGARIIALCNSPGKLNYFTLTFRAFSPTPGGFEFRPGRDYYLMSTSTGRNIYNREGGSCSEHNMRLKFRMRNGSEAGARMEETKSRPDSPSPAAASSAGGGTCLLHWGIAALLMLAAGLHLAT